MLDVARRWLSLGIPPIPVLYGSKRPCVAWSRYQDRLPTDDELRLWFENRRRNLALLCGWQGLTVLDFDEMDVYFDWFAWAVQEAPEVASITYQALTNRGVHVYVALETPIGGTLKLVDVDVKAAGGYVIAPPSVHPSGRLYEALEPGAPIVRVGSLADVLPVEMMKAPAMPRGTEQRHGAARPHNAKAKHNATQQRQSKAQCGTVEVSHPRQLAADPWTSAASPARLAGDGPGLVDDIMRRRSIRDLFPGARKNGRYLWARCPLHDDHDPSLAIDLGSDRAKCWAGCTGGGWWDYIDWYAATNGLSNAEAIHDLSNV